MNVYQAIAAVMGDLSKSGISKEQTNTFDKYKFRGIDDVYNALAPLLAKHGLVVLPRVLERHSVERESAKGGALFYVTVKVEFDFVSAEDSTTHTICAYGEAMDRGDKGTNKAMTAAYKYACFEAFCIPTEGSDDADSESHTVKATKVAGGPSEDCWEQAEAVGWSKVAINKVATTALEYWDIKDIKGALEYLSMQEMAQEAKIALNTLFPSAFRSAMKKQHEANKSQAIEV